MSIHKAQSGLSPMDAIMELAEGRNATRRVRSWMARYGAQEESFAGAPPILTELPGTRLRVLVVSESTVERTTIGVGTALAAANREAATSAQIESADGAEESAAPAPAAPERLFLCWTAQ